jgi:hypothetical protein
MTGSENTRADSESTMVRSPTAEEERDADGGLKWPGLALTAKSARAKSPSAVADEFLSQE